MDRIVVPKHVFQHIEEMEQDMRTPELKLKVQVGDSLTMERPSADKSQAAGEKIERKLPLEPGVKLFATPSTPTAAAMEK